MERSTEGGSTRSSTRKRKVSESSEKCGKLLRVKERLPEERSGKVRIPKESGVMKGSDISDIVLGPKRELTLKTPNE